MYSIEAGNQHDSQATYGRTRKGTSQPTAPAIFGLGSTPLPISILESTPSRSSKTKFLTSTVSTAYPKKSRECLSLQRK